MYIIISLFCPFRSFFEGIYISISYFFCFCFVLSSLFSLSSFFLCREVLIGTC